MNELKKFFFSKNKGQHGNDPWSHRILPLIKLDVTELNKWPNDHGYALQAENHGKNAGFIKVSKLFSFLNLFKQKCIFVFPKCLLEF